MGGNKTRGELKKIVFNSGFQGSESTYYRAIQDLERDESILYTYQLNKNTFTEEADEKQVFEHINSCKNTTSPDVLEYRLSRIRNIAKNKRITMIPKVLDFCENALKTPKYSEKSVLRELRSLFVDVLNFERMKKPVSHQEIVERIQKEALNSIINISEMEVDYDVLVSMISFFQITTKEDSVNAIFRLITKLTDKTYDRVKYNVTQALFNENSLLRSTQQLSINKDIDSLLSSNDQKVRERGRELSKYG